METFELRYFVGAARTENIRHAAEDLSVSPGSLSKAISRLERELGVRLFHREGRGIRLTDHGRILQRRAAEILVLEEAARVELIGEASPIEAILAGPETLLSHFGINVSRRIEKRYPRAAFQFHACDQARTIEKVVRREAHLGIVTGNATPEVDTKLLGSSHFQTYVGDGHPFYAAAKQGKTLPIEQVLEEAFVSPDHPLLGEVGKQQSLDGWRDDKFPRKVRYRASSLKVLEAIVAKGIAIAYLPDYLAAALPILPLKISGCPYACTQKIRLVLPKAKDVGWIGQVFSRA